MSNLLDAYGNPFDPGPVVAQWKNGSRDEAVAVLWERLHHQGDIGTASLAAVPALVEFLAAASQPDWNAYALIATIEETRVARDASMPAWLAAAYAGAWKAIVPLAIRDLSDASEDELVRSILAVIAHGKGQNSLGAIALCTEDERVEMLG